MGVSFGARLFLALLLHPVLPLAVFFAGNEYYCHAIDTSHPPQRTVTTTTTNDAGEKIIVRAAPRRRPPSPSRPNDFVDRAIAGGTSRALAQAVLYPLDALRTLSQTRDCRTLADVGVRSLLNGCFQTSAVALLTGASQFGIYGLLEERRCCGGPLISSALAAMGSCVFSVPQEVVKQRLVTGVYDSFRSAVVEIWRTEGASGFYSGWRPTMSRNVPFVIATFASRDALRGGIVGFKKRRRRWDDDGDGGGRTTVAEDVGIGIASALMACLLTQPIDVVKTRMMTQAASRAIPYASALDCASSILRTEGWRRLYSGVGHRGLYMGGLWGMTFGLEPVMINYLVEREAKRHVRIMATIETSAPNQKVVKGRRAT
ncbi:hypothetical protein ACHAW5_001037 [Stephanodiscus triporus]|uniref:Mitochondrial carrier protein n=1 Tax=Stephanodiscus triporus TaxID=2934178 RepID=A0ABD3P8T7_9STRA